HLGPRRARQGQHLHPGRAHRAARSAAGVFPPRRTVNELRLIDAFLAPFGLSRDARASGPGVLSGPGDDCAVVRPSTGRKLVLKVDELVERVHFDWRWFAPHDVGRTALAAALSDLAAA